MVKELRNFLIYIFKSKLLITGFIIYFLFNLSALKTSWFDYFYFGSSIHYCCQGLDFYGIPNGVYSFLNGGDFSGNNLPEGIKAYSGNIISNPNDYHPLLALPLGFLFLLFNPMFSFYLWMIIKIFITLMTVFYIYKNFSENRFLNFGIFIFLINFSQYNEIKISQYQFIFNIFLLFFLINLYKNKNMLENGVLLFLTIISKPISLLFIPVLILKKYYTVSFLGLGLFIISTFIFMVLGIGQHYVNNLMYHLLHPKKPDSIDFMTLNAFISYTFNLSQEIINIIKYFSLIGIYLISISKKTALFTSIFLLITYFLFFYDNLLEYHWSILGPLLAICVITLPEFQSKIARFLIIIISLPTVFFILRLLNFNFVFDPIYGPNPTMTGWQIVLGFQILPLLLLVITVLFNQFKIKYDKD